MLHGIVANALGRRLIKMHELFGEYCAERATKQKE